MQLAKRAAEIEDLKKQILSLDAQVQALKSSEANHLQEIDKYQGQLTQLEIEAGSLRAKNTELESLLKSLQEIKDEYEQAIEKLQLDQERKDLLIQKKSKENDDLQN